MSRWPRLDLYYFAFFLIIMPVLGPHRKDAAAPAQFDHRGGAREDGAKAPRKAPSRHGFTELKCANGRQGL